MFFLIEQYKYPIVITIVLYTGNKKWNAKLDLRKVRLKWKNYEGQEFSKSNILDINEKIKELIEKLGNGGKGKMLAVLDMIDRENRRILREAKKEVKKEVAKNF